MEDKNVKNVRTRRELILAVLRYAALGGLVGGISLLGRRKGEPDCRRSVRGRAVLRRETVQ